MKKIFISLVFLGSLIYASETLAIVNKEKITDAVAPKNFKSLKTQEKKIIVDHLIEKKLACEYVLSTDIVNTKEFKKVFEHIMGYSANIKSKSLKDSIAGYTKEQLYSKKGLLAFDLLLDQKAKNMKPSAAVLKKYYKENRYKYDTPHILELYTIVVDSKKTADKIIKKLSVSKNILTDFSHLATQYSQAPSKMDGGYFGKIAVLELNDVLKPELENLKQNEYTKQPIKTEFGYQLYYVVNNIPRYESKFDEVKLDVKDDYVKKATKKWAYDKIIKLKEKAKIKKFI